MALEGIEATGPVDSIRLEPCVQVHERLGSQAIHTPLRISAHLHQAGVAEHLEMARHTRLMHADLDDQIGHGALTVSHRIEDAPPSRFSDRIEHIERHGHVVDHTPTHIYGQAYS